MFKLLAAGDQVPSTANGTSWVPKSKELAPETLRQTSLKRGAGYVRRTNLVGVC
jgi:hypothetical protein